MTAKVQGGGITGQAGAVCQGVARALKVMFGPAPAGPAVDGEEGESAMSKKLLDSGFLTCATAV